MYLRTYFFQPEKFEHLRSARREPLYSSIGKCLVPIYLVTALKVVYLTQATSQASVFEALFEYLNCFLY